MRCFILAGGFATRLWPLTEKRAKPLLPLAGKPLLTHIVEGIPEGISVTVSTNAAFGEAFEAWKKTLRRTDIAILIERTQKEDEKLGALGAVAQWIQAEKVEDDVLLLTGDNYFGFSLRTFLDAWQKNAPLLAAYDIGDRTKASSFGTVILEQDGKTVKAFEEKPKDPQTTLVSTGCSILPKSALPILCQYAVTHPDNVGGIFEELRRQGTRVDCFTFKEPWFDIGSFEAYLEATRSLAGGNTLISAEATVERCRCEGTVVIGKGSTVRDCVLKDTVIFENCDIEDSVLRECVIDDGCVLVRADLDRKMLRAGTVLKRGEF